VQRVRVSAEPVGRHSRPSHCAVKDERPLSSHRRIGIVSGWEAKRRARSSSHWANRSRHSRRQSSISRQKIAVTERPRQTHSAKKDQDCLTRTLGCDRGANPHPLPHVLLVQSRRLFRFVPPRRHQPQRLNTREAKLEPELALLRSSIPSRMFVRSRNRRLQSPSHGSSPRSTLPVRDQLLGLGAAPVWRRARGELRPCCRRPTARISGWSPRDRAQPR
jgi:hypothetical protein